jgi:hypothetical protein
MNFVNTLIFACFQLLIDHLLVAGPDLSACNISGLVERLIEMNC